MKIKFKNEFEKNETLPPKKLIEIILKDRGIEDISDFVHPKDPLKISLGDFGRKYPDLIKKVIKILKKARERNEMIVVYTDYDADGITGGAVLWETLFLMGFKVMPYVPDRRKEGYGFSITGIDNVIKSYNPSLIISVDHGITKVKEIEYAKSKGIKVIVTDHHLKAEKIPKADAIFHIPVLSGSGVAYFFTKEIFNRLKSSVSNKAIVDKLTDNFSTDYLSLASIGTIADLVPLIGPSRSVAKYGLEVFPKVKRYGIKHILKQAGIEGKEITPYEVGFIIAPRINAVGRLSNAIDALRLLCTTDNKRAFDLAQKIGDLNSKRQDIVEGSVDEAKEMINKKYLKGNKLSDIKEDRLYNFIPKILILTSDSWSEGIIGLIASKLTEEFYRPTIVMTKNDGHYKASARSIPSFHITNFLRSLKKYLVDVGGHAQAAGFTIEAEKLDGFIKSATSKANELIKEKDLEKVIIADISIPISKISFPLVENLQALEPFGIGNPKPIFLSKAIVTEARLFGKDNNHLKIFVKDTDDNKTEESDRHPFELIAFHKGELFKDLSRDQEIKIVYSMDINSWNGKKEVRGILRYWEKIKSK